MLRIFIAVIASIGPLARIGPGPDPGTGNDPIVLDEGEALDTPRPVAAWPSGPLEVRVAFDRPVPEGIASEVLGSTIRFEAPPRAGEGAPDVGRLRIADARQEDGGRTLVLDTDPHPWDAKYVLSLPSLGEGEAEVDYDLSGVEVSWEPDGGEAAAIASWRPGLDMEAIPNISERSVPQGGVLDRPRTSGVLTLRTLLDLPPGPFGLKLEASGPLAIESAELDYEPAEVEGGTSIELAGESAGPSSLSELVVGLRTGGVAEGEPAFHASYRIGTEMNWRPIPPGLTRVPWAPGRPPEPAAVAAIPEVFRGGDPIRGAEVFEGQAAKCSTCHAIRGEGGKVGPDLTDIQERDPALIYRDVADPSAVIHPDYVPYTIVLKDGRILTGVVRAESGGVLRVLDTNAEETRVARSDVEELRPSSTSVMPVGLVGAIGEQAMRDLLAFLTAKPE